MVRLSARTLLLLPVLAGFCLARPAIAQPPLTLKEPGGEIRILADRMEQMGDDGLLIATGNVEITRGASRLTADRVEYNRKTGEAVAEGRAIFYDGEDRLLGDRIEYNLKTGTGVVHNASAFSDPYYRLTGERMERIDERVYGIRRGVFTTCEGDPPAWAFHAGEATLYLDDYVVGRNASFWVGRVPLIPWVPFFAAPIRRERQTGFLFPRLGVSSRKGYFANVPFYWAISDSQDLTFSLDAFTKRGVGGAGEYRYILSESNRGSVGGFFIRETLKDNDDRANFVLKHDWQLSPSFSFKADVDMVSDDRFFREYGDQLLERSRRQAQSRISLTKRWESWNFVGDTFWYQDLTTGQSVELQRLPEVRLYGARQPVPGIPWLLYETEASFVNFVRDVGSDGQRLDLHPRVYLPISVGGIFTITPFVGGRGTYYDKRVVGTRLTSDGQAVEVTEDTSRIRALAELGVDAETRVSRVFDMGGTGGIGRLQHLIEPRVNITEVRGVNQNGLPQFDSGEGIVNATAPPLSQLGIDNIGRISRLTYSVTNRLNAKSVAGQGQEGVRWELLRFVLAQTYDLPPDKSSSERLGDLVGQMIVQPNRVFSLRGDTSYNFHGRGFETFNTDVAASIRDITATVGTRFNDRERVDFVRGQIQAKVSRYLDVRGGTNWDARSGTVVESRFGVDFHFQCWGIVLEYVDRARNETEFRFGVNLLGLGAVGRRPWAGWAQ